MEVVRQLVDVVAATERPHGEYVQGEEQRQNLRRAQQLFDAEGTGLNPNDPQQQLYFIVFVVMPVVGIILTFIGLLIKEQLDEEAANKARLAALGLGAEAEDAFA